MTGTAERGMDGRGNKFLASAAGYSPIAHSDDDAFGSPRHPEVTTILQQNQVFFADTSVGHRGWKTVTQSKKGPGISHTMHNSHVLRHSQTRAATHAAILASLFPRPKRKADWDCG